MFNQKRIGILGTGKIARVMAGTIKKMKNVKLYGVASRCEERAQEFASEYGIKIAYTSYEEMMLDSKIDLVYIATPHSEHYKNMKMCIENGKNVLCEKAFTANAAQAEEIIKLSHEKGVFVAEAMWTRYMPMLATIRSVLGSGIIGEPTMLTANLGYNIAEKERIVEPSLAGGALLDIGIYTLNFAAMMFGKDVEKIDASCTKLKSGVDASDSITITYKDGKMAVLNATVNGISDRRGVIYGTKGYIVVENINNFESVTVYDSSYKPGKPTKAPKQISGYEYEVYSCIKAIDKGEVEPWEMPHDETLRIMKQMDEIRAMWGIVYPFETESGQTGEADVEEDADQAADNEEFSKPIQAVVKALGLDEDDDEDYEDTEVIGENFTEEDFIKETTDDEAK